MEPPVISVGSRERFSLPSQALIQSATRSNLQFEERHPLQGKSAAVNAAISPPDRDFVLCFHP
jgi:hypothetical protein